MAFTNTKENGLESLIVKWLVEYNGYEQGTNADYNRDYAIDETRLFHFLQDTQPDALDKLGVFKTDMKKKQFLNRLQGEIAKRGVIDVLRNGVKVYPANLIMFYLTPTENNAKAKEMYEKNIFSVTRQLMYSNDSTRLALDMCVFINGLPVITFELKNQLTKQNVDDAVQQYKDDRDPRELLFQFKRCMLLLFEGKNQRLPPEKRSQTIVYYNGRAKAIAAARSFAESRGILDKNDPELDSLSKDIMQEVHGDYYLASMIKKGVAYHIGYLPASIRTRIEDLFQKGNITIMFCTSTLLEGVNLPADNLFITDNKIFRRKMNPVDFRNLIGRVGRISYNLYGNVFFVSDEKSVSSESYIEMLQEPIPEQELSIESNPQALKRVEKKYIAEILKSGSSEIPKRREDQSEESYVMMRKFGLILLRDIMEERDSLVHREFSDFLTVEDEQQIRENFNSSPTLPDDDINTSVDQTKRLIIAIKNGLEYPSSKNGFKYDDIIDFFNKLSKIFDWPIYEKSTLGNESKRKWYAVILSQWMEGSGLSYIMQRAIDYHKQHPENFWVSAYQPPTIYNDNSKEHRNVVFADTLEAIENIALFSISNYFLRFSNEYKKIHGVDEFDNNWYEYVEFGTTNPLTILLQRNGFSRESATFIKKHKDEYVAHDGSTDELRLRVSLLDCGNTSVMTEAASIRFNAPKLFLEEDA